MRLKMPFLRRRKLPFSVARELLRICRDDANQRGKGKGRLRVVDSKKNYKSSTFYVGYEGDAPEYAIKIEEQGALSRWNPQREMQGLEFAMRALRGSGHTAIVPVGYSLRPNLLVTRYQEGRLLRPIFDRGITGWWRRKQLDDASTRAEDIAEWLRVFRSSGTSVKDGMGAARLWENCRGRANELNESVGPSVRMNELLRKVRHYLEVCPNTVLSELENAKAVHGDLAPQNFIVVPSGKLCALDLEGFHFSPLEEDMCSFRERMVNYSLRGMCARRRAQLVWQAFAESYNMPVLGFLSYVHRLMAKLAFRHVHPERRRGPFKTGIRMKLWARSRFEWLSELPYELEPAVKQFYQRL